MSMGLVEEQELLFDMCERFMDLCHAFNKRSGLSDCFLIRKVSISGFSTKRLNTLIRM